MTYRTLARCPQRWRADRIVATYAKGDLVLDGLGLPTSTVHGEVYRTLEVDGKFEARACSRAELQEEASGAVGS